MSKKIKYIIIIICSIVAFFIAMILSHFINTSILENKEFTFNNFFSLKNVLLSLIILVFLSAIILINFYIKKSKNKSQNRFGNRKLLSDAELNKKYKKNTFKSINNNDNIGILVKSKINFKKELTFNLINNTHGLVVGTTRSGKTVNLVAPQIQIFAKSKVKPSFLIIDPKKELYDKNSKVLKDNGYNIMVLDLISPLKSKRFNVLNKIYLKYKKLIELQKIENVTDDLLVKIEALKINISADINDLFIELIPESNNSDSFWKNKARNLLIGLLYGRLEDMAEAENIESQKEVTFSQILSIINSDKEELKNYINNRPRTSECYMRCAEIINSEAETTKGGIISQATEILEMLCEKGIKYISSGNDFSFKKINEEPTAFFLIVPDENKSRYIYANLVIKSIYKTLLELSRKFKNNKFERPFYFLLEEFGTTIKINEIADWLNIAGGRNIWFLLIVQELSQIEEKYGKNNATSILAGCGLKIYLLASEKQTLNYFSDLFGSTTFNSKTTSISKNNNKENVSFSESEVEKKLVSVDELKSNNFGEGYLIYSRDLPAKTSFVPVYNDNYFNIGMAEEEIINYYHKDDEFFNYDISSVKFNKKLNKIQKNNKFNDKINFIKSTFLTLKINNNEFSDEILNRLNNNNTEGLIQLFKMLLFQNKEEANYNDLKNQINEFISVLEEGENYED